MRSLPGQTHSPWPRPLSKDPRPATHDSQRCSQSNRSQKAPSTVQVEASSSCTGALPKKPHTMADFSLHKQPAQAGLTSGLSRHRSLSKAHPTLCGQSPYLPTTHQTVHNGCSWSLQLVGLRGYTKASVPTATVAQLQQMVWQSTGDTHCYVKKMQKKHLTKYNNHLW